MAWEAGTVVLDVSPPAPPAQAVESHDAASSPTEPACPPLAQSMGRTGMEKEGACIQLRAVLGEAGEPWPAPTLQINL